MHLESSAHAHGLYLHGDMRRFAERGDHSVHCAANRHRAARASAKSIQFSETACATRLSNRRMLHGGESVIGHDRRDVKAAWRAIFAIVRYSPWRGDDAIFGAKGKSTAHSSLRKTLSSCVAEYA